MPSPFRCSRCGCCSVGCEENGVTSQFSWVRCWCCFPHPGTWRQFNLSPRQRGSLPSLEASSYSGWARLAPLLSIAGPRSDVTCELESYDGGMGREIKLRSWLAMAPPVRTSRSSWAFFANTFRKEWRAVLLRRQHASPLWSRRIELKNNYSSFVGMNSSVCVRLTR